MSYIAFPLRLRHGRLERTEERGGFEAVLGIMARTSRGSWPGHPLFGFHDFFTGSAIRKDLPEPTIEEINGVLRDLGLGHYFIISLIREVSETAANRESRPSDENGNDASRRHPEGSRHGSGVSQISETFTVSFRRGELYEKS